MRPSPDPRPPAPRARRPGRIRPETCGPPPGPTRTMQRCAAHRWSVGAKGVGPWTNDRAKSSASSCTAGGRAWSDSRTGSPAIRGTPRTSFRAARAGGATEAASARPMARMGNRKTRTPVLWACCHRKSWPGGPGRGKDACVLSARFTRTPEIHAPLFWRFLAGSSRAGYPPPPACRTPWPARPCPPPACPAPGRSSPASSAAF